MSKLIYALVSSGVVTGAAFSLATLAADYAPKGPAGEALERFVLSPGQMIVERVEDEKLVKRLRKTGRKELEKGKEALDDAADKLEEKLEDYELGGAADSLRDKAERLTKLYTVASWAAVGFALSLICTLGLGVSSLKTAVSLGVKVSLLMVFLQAALVFGGVLVYQRLVQ